MQDGAKSFESGGSGTYGTSNGVYAVRLNWSPSQLTTLGWWDASDTSSITAPSAPLVDQINDLSGGGYHLTQTGSDRMNTGTQTLNNLNVLHSASTGKWMNNAALPMPSSGNFCLTGMAVLEGQGVTEFASLVSMNSATNDFQLDAESPTQFDGRLNGLGGTTSITGGPYTIMIWSIEGNFSTNTRKVYMNGVERLNDTLYTTKIDTPQDVAIFAARNHLSSIRGKFAEMYVYEACTDENRIISEGYLAHKWGVSSLLPSSHKYKNTFPII